MRQVPTGKNNSNIRLLLLGNGKLAFHLNHLLTAEKHVFQWIKNARQFVYDSKQYSDHVIWLAIKDDAIAPTANEILQKNKNAKLIHSSGALNIDNTFKLHPLYTFSTELYLKEIYHSIPWGMNALASANGIADAFSFIKNKFIVQDHESALYHAFAVLSSNFPAILWSTVKSRTEKIQIPFETYIPLILKTLENINSKGEFALTGPLIRKDKETIKKHLQVLDSKIFEELYEVFGKIIELRTNSISSERKSLSCN